jgi:hypothetical protein
MASLMRRRPLLLGVFVVACLVVAAVALGGVGRIDRAVAGTPAFCAPRPCAAPHGFEIDITGIPTENGRLVLHVMFTNRTKPDTFEYVPYRHTSPADFQLRTADGHQEPPVFSSDCPDWHELRIQRGARAGPLILCFKAPAAVNGAQLIWSPDLGFLFDDVQIPLESAAPAQP